MRPEAPILLLSAGLGLAPQSSDPPQLRVTGRSIVTTSPDRAELDVGVVTEAAEAQEAARQNAQKLDAALAALRAAAGPEAKLETVSYSLHPIYRPKEPRGEPVLSGYTANNTIRVSNLDLDAVGTVIDAVTSAGANTVHNIQFGLRDEEAVKARALREAAADAREKAGTLAEALSVRVVRILTAIEGEPDIVRPMPMYREMAMAQTAGPPTPVEPGTVEVRATVTLIVEIAQ